MLHLGKSVGFELLKFFPHPMEKLSKVQLLTKHCEVKYDFSFNLQVEHMIMVPMFCFSILQRWSFCQSKQSSNDCLRKGLNVWSAFFTGEPYKSGLKRPCLMAVSCASGRRINITSDQYILLRIEEPFVR